MEISEQDFNTTEEFFEYCSSETGKVINSWTLNKTFKSKWDDENTAEIINIDKNYIITFDSSGYSLIKL